MFDRAELRDLVPASTPGSTAAPYVPEHQRAIPLFVDKREITVATETKLFTVTLAAATFATCTEERREIEELLPWFATGTLAERDAPRVEHALATDCELADRLALVRAELVTYRRWRG
jgi:hypothetical protein